MDFSLTDEQNVIKNMGADFAKNEIAPIADEAEKTGKPPYDVISKMGELGMMGVPFPEKYGGSGGDWVSQMILVEELSKGDPGIGGMLDVTNIVAEELYRFGTEEQKQKWLIPIVKGEKIGAFALTEPEAGSDAGATKTTAVLDGDNWVINGTKQFITNIAMDNASIVILTAKCPQLENKLGKKRVINTFIVPKGTPGFSIATHWDKLAWKWLPSVELSFDNCRIPKDYILGEEGRGFAQHLEVLQTGRIFVAAIAVGVARACYEDALSYAKERHQFGQPIYNFQSISFKLADMSMHIELARQMYLKAAWLKDKGKSYTMEASYAKLFASEMAEKVASDAVQIHGGYGLMSDFPVSRFYAAAKVLQIVEGTSEVQRLVISRFL
ncbi:MAG: acyl-CoA dehydrogenase family protein [Deferribacterota bacterium]|nr:acyl-CoA dehydrogenase family protein [Deferribacterota bacterium]